jgi:hypothetical protein
MLYLPMFVFPQTSFLSAALREIIFLLPQLALRFCPLIPLEGDYRQKYMNLFRVGVQRNPELNG